MKIAGIALAVLMLLGSALIGVLGSNKSFDLEEKVSEVTAAAPALAKEANLPSAGRLKAGGIVGLLAALGAIAMLVVTFVKRDRIPVVAAATLVLCAVAAILYPGFEAGPTDGMAPRPQAFLAAGLALAGIAGSFLAGKSARN